MFALMAEYEAALIRRSRQPQLTQIRPAAGHAGGLTRSERRVCENQAVTTQPAAPSELTVRSESVQRIYNLYLSDRFRVNRRYQRKLVWSVEEKQRLIDSLGRDLPVPLFLVAELGSGQDQAFELIDGMQRLNAIFSFIENEYAVDSEYFDLDALADTKLLKDRDELRQKTPVMSRDTSVAIANYSIALSIFRPLMPTAVDDVFRRINSGGRRLSRQGLRQAGTLSPLADLVRVISSRVRGDTSPGDIVPLNKMPQLSITNRDLDYGVAVDDIFWVREKILRREEVRQSADEQLILDILIDCLIDPLQNSGTRIRDDYYSYSDSEEEESQASRNISLAIEAYGPERLESDVLSVYDVLRDAVSAAGDSFSKVIDAGSGGRAPRYFHGVFLGLWQLMFVENLRVKEHEILAQRLRGVANNMNIPAGGGDWIAAAKRATMDAVKGRLRDAMEPAPVGEDLGRYGLATQLETLLSNALVEQQGFECKQGFASLGSNRDFDADSFQKILRTATAMANAGPSVTGYIAIGIADSEADAQRIKAIDGINPVRYRRFHVVGLEREARRRGTDLNNYWTWLVQRLRTSQLDPSLSGQIAADARIVNYRGLCVALLKVRAGAKPFFFEGALAERQGSSTVNVQLNDYQRVFNRFASLTPPLA
jgi:Protein of unknown function DUF262